jgi:hypothetical protein
MASSHRGIRATTGRACVNDRCGGSRLSMLRDAPGVGAGRLPDLGTRVRDRTVRTSGEDLVRAFQWDALSPQKGFVQTVANSH